MTTMTNFAAIRTGKAIGLAAHEARKNRKPGEKALDLLDKVCIPYKGQAVNFSCEESHDWHDAYGPCYAYNDPHPYAQLGLLMVEAFSPKGLSDYYDYLPMLALDVPDHLCEEAEAEWNAKVNFPFLKRYRFV